MQEGPRSSVQVHLPQYRLAGDRGGLHGQAKRAQSVCRDRRLPFVDNDNEQEVEPSSAEQLQRSGYSQSLIIHGPSHDFNDVNNSNPFDTKVEKLSLA